MLHKNNMSTTAVAITRVLDINHALSVMKNCWVSVSIYTKKPYKFYHC